jgi:hypothetical protein
VFRHGLLATGNTVDTYIVTSSTEVCLSIILISLTLRQSLTQVAVLDISYYAIRRLCHVNEQARSVVFLFGLSSSLDYPFLIAPSVFSKVLLSIKIQYKTQHIRNRVFMQFFY